MDLALEAERRSIANTALRGVPWGFVAAMTTRVAEPAETGVFYAPEDLAGLSRRIFVVAVDLTVVVFLLVPVGGLSDAGLLSSRTAVVSALVVAWAYLGWLKVTKFRTLGYRFAHVELVDLRGTPATVWRSTLRFLFFVLYLGNLVDLVLITHDSNRQALRDKLVGTYVVRKGAQPIGSGPVSYPTYFVGGLTLVFREVLHDDANPPTIPDHPDS